MLWEGEQPPHSSMSLLHPPCHEQFMAWGFPGLEVVLFCLLNLEGSVSLLLEAM